MAMMIAGPVCSAHSYLQCTATRVAAAQVPLISLCGGSGLNRKRLTLPTARAPLA